MSSFPVLTKNIERLKALGFDPSEYLDPESDDPVFDLWNHDDLTLLLSDVIDFFEKKQGNPYDLSS